MIERYMEFLKEINFFPVNKDNWNSFEVEHITPVNLEKRLQIERFITQQVEKKGGIYLYQNLNNDILYIGKAKLLRTRLVSHYRESFQQVPGDTKNHKWHRFFLKHQGRLRVYWKELSGEDNRKIVELMLDYILKPGFREWK